MPLRTEGEKKENKHKRTKGAEAPPPHARIADLAIIITYRRLGRPSASPCA